MVIFVKLLKTFIIAKIIL